VCGEWSTKPLEIAEWNDAAFGADPSRFFWCAVAEAVSPPLLYHGVLPGSSTISHSIHPSVGLRLVTASPRLSPCRFRVGGSKGGRVDGHMGACTTLGSFTAVFSTIYSSSGKGHAGDVT